MTEPDSMMNSESPGSPWWKIVSPRRKRRTRRLRAQVASASSSTFAKRAQRRRASIAKGLSIELVTRAAPPVIEPSTRDSLADMLRGAERADNIAGADASVARWPRSGVVVSGPPTRRGRRDRPPAAETRRVGRAGR